MLCLNKEALKDKYLILDGSTPLRYMDSEPLNNADEPALLVRDGEIVLYYGQALHIEPIDNPSYDRYFFENYYKVEAQCHYHTDGFEQYSLSRLHDEKDLFVSFMAPIHYVTDPEVYQTVSLDPFAGTDKSHPYPYHILVKHDEFDEDHTSEYYLDGMSAFIGFSLEAPEDKQVCLVREYEGRYTPRFISGDELLKECNPEVILGLIEIPDDEKKPSPNHVTADTPDVEKFDPDDYADYMELNEMEIEYIYVFVRTHLGRMYHISESEYKNLDCLDDAENKIYGYRPCKYDADPHPYWYGRRCIRYARCSANFKIKDMPKTLVEGIHFIIDSDDDPAYENGQHSVLWKMFNRKERMMRSDDQAQ